MKYYYYSVITITQKWWISGIWNLKPNGVMSTKILEQSFQPNWPNRNGFIWDAFGLFCIFIKIGNPEVRYPFILGVFSFFLNLIWLETAFTILLIFFYNHCDYIYFTKYLSSSSSSSSSILDYERRRLLRRVSSPL